MFRGIQLIPPDTKIGFVKLRTITWVVSALLTVALWPHFGWGTLVGLALAYTLLAAWVFRTLAVEHAATPPLLLSNTAFARGYRFRRETLIGSITRGNYEGRAI